MALEGPSEAQPIIRADLREKPRRPLNSNVGHHKTMIRCAEKVEAYFGYWPLFCDAKITNFAFAQPGTIILVIAYIDAEKHKGAEVSLKFTGVTEVELSELRSENVIDALRIPEEFPAQVTLVACYGLEGSFRCTAVEVSSVMPNPTFERDCAKARSPSI